MQDWLSGLLGVLCPRPHSWLVNEPEFESVVDSEYRVLSTIPHSPAEHKIQQASRCLYYLLVAGRDGGQTREKQTERMLFAGYGTRYFYIQLISLQGLFQLSVIRKRRL